jgi:SAM-dependent methyltransferase
MRVPWLGRLGTRLPPERRRRLLRPAWFGTLRRTTPLSSSWGYDRGTPIDRYYIEAFLREHRDDIRGRVLEVRDSAYTERFGHGVTRRDVLDIDLANSRATIVADLAAAEAVPADHFDCFVLTQTLQFIYNLQGALAHARRILAPGGALLATVPVISRIDGALAKSDYWRFTDASCARLFGEGFGPGNVTVRSYGNVLAAMGFLAGVAYEELTPRELEHRDAYFPVIVGIRAVKR